MNIEEVVNNYYQRTNMNMIEEAVKKYYGERCPDHDADCIICQAWEEFDTVKHDLGRYTHLINRYPSLHIPK